MSTQIILYDDYKQKFIMLLNAKWYNKRRYYLHNLKCLEIFYIFIAFLVY